MLLAVCFTWEDLLGVGGEGGFTFVQKYTGYISPGIVAVFLLGMFWKRTTATAAIVGILAGFSFSLLFNDFAPRLFGPETLLYSAFRNSEGVYEVPFLVSMGWSFFLTTLLMVLISLAGPRINPKSLDLDTAMFRVTPRQTALIAVILLLITALYVKFW